MLLVLLLDLLDELLLFFVVLFEEFGLLVDGVELLFLFELFVVRSEFVFLNLVFELLLLVEFLMFFEFLMLF